MGGYLFNNSEMQMTVCIRAAALTKGLKERSTAFQEGQAEDGRPVY